MADASDEAKLKAVVKAALVEVLEERPDLLGVIQTRSGSQFVNLKIRTLIFFVGFLVTAILLYQIISRGLS